MNLLKPGTEICDVYNGGVSFLESKDPSLVPHLPKSFGFGVRTNAFLTYSRLEYLSKRFFYQLQKRTPEESKIEWFSV
jgi:hypothetical protein